MDTGLKRRGFPNANTGLNYADFLLGASQSWNANLSPEYGRRLKDVQMFIQDDYKPRPNLTLNLGLRYQIRHGWSETHGNVASFDPTRGTGVGSLVYIARQHGWQDPVNQGNRQRLARHRKQATFR